MVAAHVFVDDLDDPVLSPDDLHHLARVLRLRAGESVSVSDGRGGRRACEWVDDDVGVVPVGEVERSASPPSPRLTIGVALAKGDKPEWAVQKLTECGIDEIVVFAADRSVVRWSDDRAPRHLARLQRVAREAAMQSRRVWLPTVSWSTFSSVAGLPGAALADVGGVAPTLAHPAVLVGPEGGWSETELGCPLPRVALGRHVLRAETAAVAAGVLLAALREDLVRTGGE